MNNDQSAEAQTLSETTESKPSDDKFADSKIDEDPRTADTTRTGVGASDLNADVATINTDSPEAVPGVRRG